MLLTYYGQSCFMVQINKSHILFDPFITPNPLAKRIDINKIKADYILVTHGHNDHIADCVAISKRTGAQVICPFEVGRWLQKQGVKKVHNMNPGGKWRFHFGTVKCVTAHHSSSMPDDSYGGVPVGYVVMADECFYYAGDTGLTLDMQLIPRWTSLNFCVLPIGDNFTMGIHDAIIASDFVKCPVVVGVHYNTFDLITINTHEAIELFKAAGKTLLLPQIGETIEL